MDPGKCPRMEGVPADSLVELLIAKLAQPSAFTIHHIAHRDIQGLSAA